MLARRPEVNAGRIGAMGICGGGGYAPYAAATDRRIKAVATVSGMTNNRAEFEGSVGGDMALLHSMLETSAAARQAYSRGEPPTYTHVIHPQATPGVPDVFRESLNSSFDDARGGHHRGENKVPAWHVEKQGTS